MLPYDDHLNDRQGTSDRFSAEAWSAALVIASDTLTRAMTE
jgi:hypothetical protein